MSEIYLTFEDLMRELEIADPSDLGKLIRVNRLPQISPKKLISRKDATEIVMKLRNREIDWYKYKTHERDITTYGPLEQKMAEDDVKYIDKWYQIIKHKGRLDKLEQDRIFGLVCQGGFLEGEEIETNEFVISLDDGINVLIGDRGAGKSTILNLVGLLTDSISEETDALVTRLIDVLSPDEESSVNRVSRITRRARKILEHYGVNLCAIFFVRSRKIACFYVNLAQNLFNVYELHKDYWRQGIIKYPIGPSMMILLQGEVIRIAEERDKFYLNNILDALYSELYLKRSEFAQEVRKIVHQFEYTDFDNMGFRPTEAFRFINKCTKELQQMAGNVARGYFNSRSIDLLKEYLEIHYRFVHDYSPENPAAWKNAHISLLLKIQESYMTLYIGRIRGFLEDKLYEIDLLRGLDQFAESQIRANKSDTEIDDEIDGEFSEDDVTLKEIVRLEEETTIIEDKIVKNNTGKNKNGEKQVNQQGDLDDDEQENYTLEENKNKELFLQAIKELETGNEEADARGIQITDPAIIDVAKQIVEYLNNRLKVLSSWVYIYSARRMYLNKSLEGLLNSYKDLLILKVKLLDIQQTKCQEITKTLNENDLPLKVTTISMKEIKDACLKDIRMIAKLDKYFFSLISAVPRTKLGEINFFARSYDSTANSAIQMLRKFSHRIKDPQNDFIFNPVNIELLQGSVYRNFEKLSFGQKSGIILEMVLLKTKRHLIVIDQPEDNLDTSSIVNMVAPTLNRLGNSRQIILTTHNSNLVMGLNTGCLFVLESFGESGRIKVQGPPSQRKVIREMMEVLEGGETTFETKLKMYEDFISRVRGQIPDMDITWIESSFRRRTIDRFRNFLQPVISDRSLLEFIRHELRQPHPDYSTLRKELIQLRATLNNHESGEDVIKEDYLLKQLSELATNLDNHIGNLQEAIEEIRMMDTDAKPKTMGIYPLLSKIKNNILANRGITRDIQILVDEKLSDCKVFFDEDHLKLIFNNLFNNSLRATELRAAELLDQGDDLLQEIVEVKLEEITDNTIILKFVDNGCGMPIEIMQKLYCERCSTQKGRDDGLGGVIIRKLMDLNYGKVQIIESKQNGENPGTIQSLILPRIANQ